MGTHGRNDGLLTHAETAQRLNVTERHLRHLVTQGYIRPAKRGRHVREALYRPEEVHALLELRIRQIDLPTVASMALQAQALGRSTADKLDKICHFLGLENNQLCYDEESVFNLHLRVQETLKEDFTTLRAGALIEWAGIFNSFDEEYLRLVEQHTLNQSPWDSYLILANTLMTTRSNEADSNLSFAYACLDSARRNLRHVAYFYVLSRHGHVKADALFMKDEVHEEVIAQLYPRVISPS